MTVPHVFANLTSPIPLLYLDDNFNAMMLSQPMPSVQDYGADPVGGTDATVAFATSVPVMSVPAGTYAINTNTAVSATLYFTGGSVTVASGKTLTLNGGAIAPNKVIFKGAGTVIVSCGEINVAWYDGTDAASKWDACARQMTNSNLINRTVVFPSPASTDAWAVVSSSGLWGYGWRVDTPILVTQPMGGTKFRTPTPFIATTALNAIWDIGSGTSKADNFHFLDHLVIDGNSNLATHCVLLEGASSFSFNIIEMHNCTNGLTIKPAGSKQVSSFHIKQVIVAENNGYGVLIEGTGAAARTVTDGVIEVINSYGLRVAGANNCVQIVGTVQNMKIHQVTNRAVPTNVDYAVAAVYITNDDTYAPAFGVEIGYVTSDSSVPLSKAFVIADSSSGAGPKIEGVSLYGAVSPITDAVDVNWCTNTNISSVDNASSINVRSNALNTYINGCKRSIVTDAGSGTLVNGLIRRIITALADDAATSIPIPAGQNSAYLVNATDSVATPANTVQFWGISYVSAAVAAIYTGSGSTIVTGVLSGTTGTNGKLNFSAGSAALYVENRTGAPITLEVTIDLGD